MPGEFEKIEVKLSALGVTKKLIKDSEDLVSIEQQYGFQLPLEYRRFLLEYGRIDFPTGISYLYKERVSEVARLGDFYNLQSDGFNSLRKNIDTYLGRMPFNLIPIVEIKSVLELKKKCMEESISGIIIRRNSTLRKMNYGITFT
ncbi:hypothetical protein GC098_15735 [Paenibacillus sp. LMG 31458]|uniref:Knr4/Smi1-like domain-containing protein n=1 Tax=Paenibacillus phytorum TaxID=2654977 RepID=A0ABX1XWE3_9BACL|nr:SMI1/KNR4 family protein [Paenibacillus phytorum]NOU72857.1 hypothetical protein [Paenibacillus phytorum]